LESSLAIKTARHVLRIFWQHFRHRHGLPAAHDQAEDSDVVVFLIVDVGTLVGLEMLGLADIKADSTLNRLMLI